MCNDAGAKLWVDNSGLQNRLPYACFVVGRRPHDGAHGRWRLAHKWLKEHLQGRKNTKRLNKEMLAGFLRLSSPSQFSDAFRKILINDLNTFIE